MSVTVAVDAMGGDHGPAVTVPSSLAFLEETPGASVVLVGRREAIDPLLARSRSPAKDRIRVRDATEVVGMDEPPADALRRKKDSSMRVAINLVRDGEAHGCVSAGNTGALMGIARFVLKTLPGIDRPAIASQLPTKTGVVTMLDLGANVNCTADQLVQFAAMGSALVSAVEGIERPTVGLLNIGEEEIKGSETIKQAGELLRRAAERGMLNFHGNVEGNDIFKGTTDIVVCDGFVGNAVLKASEGLATMLSDFIRQEFTRTLASKLAALVALPVLNHFKARVDPRRYNGAALLGLRGLVFKSHGSADAFAFEHALERAYDAARNGLLARVHVRIHDTLQALAEGGEQPSPPNSDLTLAA